MSRDNMEIMAIIPARGGSKDIPHKSVCLLAGVDYRTAELVTGYHEQNLSP